MAKIRERIELNKTNKQLSGQLDILCDDFVDLEQKFKAIKHEYEIVKDNIKSRLSKSADYFTTKFKIVMSITPAKTEFKYDIEKILKAYPEIKENIAFGEFQTRAEVKTLKSVEGIKKN